MRSKWQPRMQHSQLEWRGSFMGGSLLKRPKVIPTPEWLRQQKSSDELDETLQSTNPHNHSRITYHQGANINKSGLEIYLCTHFSLYSWTRGSVLPRDESSQSNGIHPYPSEYDHIPSAWHVLCSHPSHWSATTSTTWFLFGYDSWGFHFKLNTFWDLVT